MHMPPMFPHVHQHCKDAKVHKMPTKNKPTIPRRGDILGVVSINLSLKVETWYRSLRDQKRSQIINRILENYINAQEESEPEFIPLTVEEMDSKGLINIAFGRLSMKTPPPAMMSLIEQARKATQDTLEELSE